MRKAIKTMCIIICVLLLAMSLGGCTQMITNVDIKTDGSADINIKAGVTSNIYEMFTSQGDTDLMSETMQEAVSAGYSVQEYSEDGYIGIVMSKHVESLEAMPDDDKYIEGLTFARTNELFEKAMSLSGTLASIQSLKQNMTDSAIDVSSFDLKLVVSVPYTITATNATEVSADNKTATFDLVTLDTIELECEHQAVLFGIIPVTGASFVVIALAVVVLVLIIIGIIKKKKRAKKAENQ